MSVLRITALAFLALVAVAAAGADWLSWNPPEMQFRDQPNTAPSSKFPLGTDALGRDRWSRVLHAIRISLVFAPASAAVSVALGSAIGLLAGFGARWIDSIVETATDLVLALPWLFLLLTLRAALPLNISPVASLAATFALLTATSWAGGARVVRNTVLHLRTSGPLQYARACGCTTPRLMWVHVLPSIRPVMVAQFWVLVPVFLLAEANLGMLGLGVIEPAPSWGNLLSELKNYERIPEMPWIIVPAALLALVVASLNIAMAERRS
jgi:peptide/nickel transport system permease protein